MGAKFKANILQAIDQAIRHCQESSYTIDDPELLIRLQGLGKSLSEQRLQIANLQEDYPPDDGFIMQMRQRVDMLSSSHMSAAKLDDMSKIADFSALLSRYIEIGRR